MTETQITCQECGDTGFVPPFMDPCTHCKAGFTARLDATADEIAADAVHPGFPPTPETGTFVHVDGTLHVFTGSEWKPVPTETLTPAEYADKHRITDLTVPRGPVKIPPYATTSATPVEWTAVEWTAVDDETIEVDEVDWATTALDAVDEADDWSGRGGLPKAPFAPTTAEKYPTPKTGMATPWLGTAEPGSTPTPGRPMTDAQKALLTKLLAERDPTNGTVYNAKVRLDGGFLTAKSASNAIDAVMKIPADPKKKPPRPNSYAGTCTTCGGPVAEMAGRIEKVDGRWRTYHLAGGCLSVEDAAKAEADRVTEPGLYKWDLSGPPVIYRVRKSRMSDRLYAEKVIPNGDGTASFSYHANAMSFLRKEHKLSWAEAREFGAAYGACVACGRTLSDPRSLVQGYGNTCGSRYSWPLVTVKQAEAIIAGSLTWDDVASIL